ncbi:hypothetical protein TL18_06615 [Methanobrevibacter sp. YE315]|uniref:MATE family efflux transporter n=1 Tax=Methanobrevibacter sp. YE315 TaxID=1609968 RepID=UPI000764D7C4|nr:MATE family efflux transporter [Methanobrevibacter sp. YE315]AMD17722.1 hypothetical protein TL18_06615 [Methanobrevibacter sp. YE315]
MEAKLERKYTFLRKKYNELLLPTFLMVMSEKICTVIDVIIIGFILGSTQLSVINLASPMTYITGIFYILFGQGGNLLALRAQSQLKHEKTNFYFTISILGICLVSIIYILAIFLFIDNILMFFNTPAEIFNLSKEYLLILMFYFPLNCYILVISFFIRSDGFPKMPFYAVLLSNILNIFFDILFLKGLGLGIEYTALASVLGYLVGAIYVSTYLFKKKGSYRLISLGKYKINDIIITIREFILNTPEVIGKIFFALKMSILTYLCSTYLGVAGLLAFLVYDNSETFVYIFLSGIMKTMSPIVTVLHKEKDGKAVRYIILHSMRHLLFISVPVSILFFIYPEILLKLFNVVDPHHAQVVSLAIRITAFSLVGRCMSYLLANYAQAIEQNKISSVITFLEEFLFAVVGALILTRMIGGIGIWFSIIMAESIPIIIYLIYTIRLKNKYNDKINRFFMIQNSKLITWTYNRETKDNVDKYLDEESKEILLYIEKYIKEDSVTISNSINDICNDIFEKTDIDDIDITIRLIDKDLNITFTTDGMRYNPFSNEDLMKSANMAKLSKMECKFDHDVILGFNKSYILINNV